MSVEVRSLSADDVDLWFELRGGPPAIGVLAKLRSQLSRGELNPLLRLIAVSEGRIVAGLSATRKYDELISFSEPFYRQHLSPQLAQVCGDALLEHLLTATGQLTVPQSILETRPADDIPGVDSWLTSLQRHGFIEIACAHLYVRGLPLHALSRDLSLSADVHFLQYRADLFDVLVDLYARSRTSTLDRRTAATMLNPRDYISELQTIGDPGFSSDLWLVAVEHDVPFGFALGAVRQDPMFKCRTGLVLEIGVVPEKRRRGFGRLLLTQALPVLTEVGAERAVSLIDDANIASLRTHQPLGFVPLPHRFMVYHKRLKD